MKSRKKSLEKGMIGLAILLLPCLQVALAQENLIYNGGFNTSSNNIDPDGWTLTGGASFNVKDGNPPPDLLMFPDATASQTINGLTAGDLYMISGNYEDGGSDTTNISFEVLLNDTAYFGAAVPTNQNWQTFSFDYTASSSSVTLTLEQTMGGPYSVGDYNIDNIAMYAVPEPGGLFLIGLGGIILAFAINISRRWRSLFPSQITPAHKSARTGKSIKSLGVNWQQPE